MMPPRFKAVTEVPMTSRLLLRSVRIELESVSLDDDNMLRFRATVPDRNTAAPIQLNFNVQLPPRFDNALTKEEELATHIRDACAQVIAHELSECILNRNGIRVIDPHATEVRFTVKY